MSTETTYGDIEPEIDWGYCPACDAVELVWHEEGPICPTCGHLWDHNGKDSGTWEDCMGEPWEESPTRTGFLKREQDRREWLNELLGDLRKARR